MTKIIAIIGIGYVGLQSAMSFAKAGVRVIAFDINEQRIKELAAGVDNNQEASSVQSDNLLFTSDPAKLREANCYLISVPTPVNECKIPDIHALKNSAQLVGSFLKKNDIVVLESTVFPGATRELLTPILEQKSNLVSGRDFYVGYSSERIVPGDETHSMLDATKVISGQNPQTLKIIKELYARIPGLKVHLAPSMEVAEASKLLENIQRNVNIALMNEFAQIMNAMGVSIYDVLDAASTKWNFIPFKPGLVGGHCIPEDPHYLIYQADRYDCVHDLISAACQINQQFYRFIIDTMLKLLVQQDLPLPQVKIAVLGMSFKPDVTDMRHSLSINIYEQLKALGFNVVACDPLVDIEKTGLDYETFAELKECNVVLLCQAHKEILKIGTEGLSKKIKSEGIFMDIPGAFVRSADFRSDITYWSL